MKFKKRFILIELLVAIGIIVGLFAMTLLTRPSPTRVKQLAVKGSCGSANGAFLISKPMNNLCSSGTASQVSGRGPWRWSCAGSKGGTTAQCSVAFGHKGINDNSLWISTPTLSQRITDYQALGVQWFRFELDWSLIQPNGPSTYNLSQQDTLIQSLRASSINVLGLIDCTPSWANNNAPSKFYPPTKPSDFASFAGYLASHYAPMGVHTWEIWNEENSASFWESAADPVAYTRLLKAAYAAIKNADPQAIVMVGGMAQPSDGGGNISALNWLQDLYSDGARPYFDAVADHPYFSPDSPTNPDGNNWQKMYNTSPSLLSIMATNGDSGKKIWITEVGAPTSGTDSYGTVISESGQASMVSQVYNFAANTSYPWLGPVFWYNFQNFSPYGSTACSPTSDCFCGLTDYSGSPKPSYSSYQSAPNE